MSKKKHSSFWLPEFLAQTVELMKEALKNLKYNVIKVI